MRAFKPLRCGNCIDSLHEDCVVEVMMGVAARGRPEKHHGTYRYIKTGPHLWRCGCTCEWAQGTKVSDPEGTIAS